MTNLFTPDEVWRPIFHLEITTPIEASNLGRIRFAETGIIKNQYRTPQYYYKVSIDGKSYFVHRLVASAFYNRVILPTEVIRHLNDDGLQNQLSNLAIGLKNGPENRLDRMKNDRWGITLRARDVSRIRADLQRGRPYKDIARQYNVSTSHIGNIKHRRRWCHHI